MTETHPPKFSLKRRSIPVPIDTDDGVHEYQLREMVAADRDKWMDLLSSRMIRDKDGKPTEHISKYDQMQATLISMCLFDKDGKPVEIKTIQSWPGGMVQDLFLEARKINGLEVDGSEKKEKKS